MELNKEKCKEALNYLCKCACELADLKLEDKQSHSQYEVSMLHELIEFHFDNTLEFKHFKLRSDIILKSLTKDELIDYIHMVYNNWCTTDWYWNNTIRANYRLLNENETLTSQVKNLNKALDEVREQGASYMDEALKYRKLYEEVLEDNELLNKEAQEIEKLKARIKELESSNAQ